MKINRLMIMFVTVLLIAVCFTFSSAIFLYPLEKPDAVTLHPRPRIYCAVMDKNLHWLRFGPSRQSCKTCPLARFECRLGALSAPGTVDLIGQIGVTVQRS